MNAHEIVALVPMPEVLRALGFEVNERTRRSACILHDGSNRSAFSWTDAGLWRCHSCSAGGDRIALVRAVRNGTFREAVEYLAALAGVEFRPRRTSRHDIAQKRLRRERAERAAWRIADEIAQLRRYYTDGLHRAERLQTQIGSELLRTSAETALDCGWERLARLAPVCTFFFAAWNFIWGAKPDVLTHFALTSSAERRRFILEGFAP
jgi:hypothetical protein